MMAKDGKIGNARSENGDRSLQRVKRDRREVCSYGEYSIRDQKQNRVPRKTKLKPNRWRTEIRHVRRPRTGQTTAERLTSGLRCQECGRKRANVWRE